MSHRECRYGDSGSVEDNDDECSSPPRYPQYDPLPEPSQIGGNAPVGPFRSVQALPLRLVVILSLRSYAVSRPCRLV